MQKSRKKKAPKRTQALPDLEHAKSAVVNSLSSASGQRTYSHAIDEFVGSLTRVSIADIDLRALSPNRPSTYCRSDTC